jgi:cell division protease FtsH
MLLLGGFAVIFWQFMPRSEITVDYSPWFLDQIESHNIKTLSVRANEVRGELRSSRPFRAGPSSSDATVVRFITYFPGESSIDAVLTKLRDGDNTLDPVRIETAPATSEPSMIWLLVVVQTILIVVLLYRVESLHARMPR